MCITRPDQLHTDIKEKLNIPATVCGTEAHQHTWLQYTHKAAYEMSHWNTNSYDEGTPEARWKDGADRLQVDGLG
jgi:hypothetical protein